MLGEEHFGGSRTAREVVYRPTRAMRSAAQQNLGICIYTSLVELQCGWTYACGGHIYVMYGDHLQDHLIRGRLITIHPDGTMTIRGSPTHGGSTRREDSSDCTGGARSALRVRGEGCGRVGGSESLEPTDYRRMISSCWNPISTVDH